MSVGLLAVLASLTLCALCCQKIVAQEFRAEEPTTIEWASSSVNAVSEVVDSTAARIDLVEPARADENRSSAARVMFDQQPRVAPEANKYRRSAAESPGFRPATIPAVNRKKSVAIANHNRNDEPTNDEPTKRRTNQRRTNQRRTNQRRTFEPVQGTNQPTTNQPNLNHREATNLAVTDLAAEQRSSIALDAVQGIAPNEIASRGATVFADLDFAVISWTAEYRLARAIPVSFVPPKKRIPALFFLS